MLFQCARTTRAGRSGGEGGRREARGRELAEAGRNLAQTRGCTTLIEPAQSPGPRATRGGAKSRRQVPLSPVPWSAGRGWRASVGAVQQVRSIQSYSIQQVGHAAFKQQHADGDRRYPVADLAVGADSDRPASLSQRDFGPAQGDIDGVIPIGLDRTDLGDLLPRDASRHQPTIENSVLIHGKHDRLGASAPAETAQEQGNSREPRDAQPPYARTSNDEACCGRQCGGKQDQGSNTDLCEAPYEMARVGLASWLLRLSRTLDESCVEGVDHGGLLPMQHHGVRH
jgi:hypothetical protein